MSFVPNNTTVQMKVWVPTMELRFKRKQKDKLWRVVLEQLWENRTTGATEWREVPLGE